MIDIVRLISGIICAIFAIFLGILSSIKPHRRHKDKLDDVPRYMKRGFREKYYGMHESKYTNIDDAQFHYILDRMKDEISGSGEKNKKLKSNIKDVTLKKSNIHGWYKFDTWEDLISHSTERHEYATDRLNARKELFFIWDKVFEKVLPYVRNEKYEIIGVLRAESDRKTLYVHDMQKSPSMESNSSYAAGVPYNLVKKFSNIPGYFLFHTHPMGINADPFPSDADLYSCLLDCYDNKFVGHIVVGEYGAIMYFLKQKRMEHLDAGGALKFFTFCYDLINAWNAFTNSSSLVSQKDRISFLEKWGFDMIIIPSPKYISDSYDKLYMPGVIHDRFIKTKYELLDKIKDFIKKLEIEDARKNKKQI